MKEETKETTNGLFNKLYHWMILHWGPSVLGLGGISTLWWGNAQYQTTGTILAGIAFVGIVWGISQTKIGQKATVFYKRSLQKNKFKADWPRVMAVNQLVTKEGDHPKISRYKVDEHENISFLITTCSGIPLERIRKKGDGIKTAVLRQGRNWKPEDAPEDIRFEAPSAGKGASLKCIIITKSLPMAGEDGASLEDVPKHADPNKVYIAETPEGPISWDIISDPHMGVYGTTGLGKGVSVSFIIAQFLLKDQPWRIHIFAPKGSGEFAFLYNCPGVTFSETYEQHQEAFRALTKERKRRLEKRAAFAEIMMDEHVDDLDVPAAVTFWGDVDDDDAPPVLVIVDETSELCLPKENGKPEEPKAPKEPKAVKGRKPTAEDVRRYEIQQESYVASMEVYLEALSAFETANELYHGLTQAVSGWRSESLHLIMIAQRPEARGFPTQVREQLTLVLQLGNLSSQGEKMTFGDTDSRIVVPRGKGRGQVGHRISDERFECQVLYLDPTIVRRRWRTLWDPVPTSERGVYDFTSAVERVSISV